MFNPRSCVIQHFHSYDIKPCFVFKKIVAAQIFLSDHADLTLLFYGNGSKRRIEETTISGFYFNEYKYMINAGYYVDLTSAGAEIGFQNTITLFT